MSSMAKALSACAESYRPPSLTRRGAAALLAATLIAPLQGCGFQPVYGESRRADAEVLAAIHVERIEDRIGQKLRTLLRERLSPKGDQVRALYDLRVNLVESKREIAIRKDESATRATLTVYADFVLTRLPPLPAGMLTGRAVSANSYNVLDSEFATLSAENDARDRALRSLADEIRLRIATAINNPAVFRIPKSEPPPVTGRR